MLLQVPRKLVGCLAECIFVVGSYEGHEIHGIVVMLVGPDTGTLYTYFLSYYTDENVVEVHLFHSSVDFCSTPACAQERLLNLKFVDHLNRIVV